QAAAGDGLGGPVRPARRRRLPPGRVRAEVRRRRPGHTRVGHPRRGPALRPRPERLVRRVLPARRAGRLPPPLRRPGPAPPAAAPRPGYAPHFYDASVEAGQDWDPSNGFIENYTAAITAYPQANHLPVLVGEWGPPNSRTPGNAELVRRQVAAMSGFAAGWT